MIQIVWQNETCVKKQTGPTNVRYFYAGPWDVESLARERSLLVLCPAEHKIRISSRGFIFNSDTCTLINWESFTSLFFAVSLEHG